VDRDRECAVVSFKLAHLDDCQTAGNWQLVRRTLELGAFGINVVEIPPGEQIPEHDETGRDQEEVFYVISGSPTLVIDGEDRLARAGTFARLDPEHMRTVRNDGDEQASVLIVSAPRASGYEPMSWA
jgi:quercetin dioxygenase-like cupin family protein